MFYLILINVNISRDMKQVATLSKSTTPGVLAQTVGQKLLVRYLRKIYCEE